MNKIIKLSILVVVIALMSLCLFGCATFERLFLGGDDYSISNVTLTQVGVDEFQIDFDVNCGRENVIIYLTEGFRLSESIKPKQVTKTSQGTKTHFSFTDKFNLAEDYYLWVVNGNKQAKTSITPPSMFPSIRMNDDGSATFEFKYTYDTAWGSFCDPTGKAVYKSDKPVFDSSAILIEEGIDITDEDCVIPAELVDTSCYYFSVSTAKEGKHKSISRPVMFFDELKGEVKELSSKITSDLKFEIAVEIPENSKFASEVADKLQLIVKTNIADEIYVVDSVYESGIATMSFDLTQLIFDGLWYDLLFAWDGAVVMDVPQYFNGRSIESASTVKKDGIIYSTVGWKAETAPAQSELLKVYFEKDNTRFADQICKSYLVTFTTDPVPTLVVKATFKDDLSKLPVLAITAGDTTKIAYSEGTLNESDGSYTFEIPVSDALTSPDKWYDLRFFIGNDAYEMLKDSCITYESFSTKYDGGSKRFEFREWNGFLKIMYLETGVK